MRRAKGAVSKYSGKRRKPWSVRITLGYDDEGRQIRRLVGMYSTKREAEQALADALAGLEPRVSMTLCEAWNEWSEQFKGADSTLNGYRTSYRKLESIQNVDLKDISLDLLQPIFNGLTYGSAKMLKNVVHNLLEYGFSRDCCPASRMTMLKYLTIPKKETKRERKAFTEEEILELIDRKAIGAVILIFTGLRIDELLSLEERDIHIDDHYIRIRKAKTSAGVREVPIPDSLTPFLETYIRGGMPRTLHLFNRDNWKPYDMLSNRTRHECRHTYITLLTTAGVDQRIVKALAGHTGTVTEDVYTHIPLANKLEAVNRVFNRFFIVSPEVDSREFRTLSA